MFGIPLPEPLSVLTLTPALGRDLSLQGRGVLMFLSNRAGNGMLPGPFVVPGRGGGG